MVFLNIASLSFYPIDILYSNIKFDVFRIRWCALKVCRSFSFSVIYYFYFFRGAGTLPGPKLGPFMFMNYLKQISSIFADLEQKKKKQDYNYTLVANKTVISDKSLNLFN